MLEVSFTAQFKKDYKLCKKRGYNLQLLKDIIDTLSIPESLPEKNRDHALTGNYVHKRECHIQPDWLLIYRIEENRLILYRMGTHTDLFK
ncbi:MAG: type II toxin-antitoxin system YafQ family toxin [Lachnospiraceae bacterium]|nr:type II toxin-antitoxin system YafQ family toxin [Lachnospiraceae bacterium]